MGRHGGQRSLVLLFMLPGVPVLYNGDELGMRDGHIKRREIQDPPGKALAIL